MNTVTILYAGLLGLLSLVLSAASGIMRGKKNIDAGDGGQPPLQQRINGCHTGEYPISRW